MNVLHAFCEVLHSQLAADRVEREAQRQAAQAYANAAPVQTSSVNERGAPGGPVAPVADPAGNSSAAGPSLTVPPLEVRQTSLRFNGSVPIKAHLMGSEAGKIMEEVVKHLQQWKTTAWLLPLALLILALYPEQLIQSIYGHLFTIFIGMLLLFWPLSALATTLIPFDTARAAGSQTRLRKGYAWLMVVLFSLSIGLLGFLAETSEGGGRGAPLARVMLVFAVFLGTGALGIMIGYAFLRKPLGLLR